MFAALILGVVQGLTEFLPISSSGHLVLAQHLFHFRELDPAFNVFIQGGTVISVLIFFRSRLVSLKIRYLKFLFFASLPAAAAGLFLEPYLTALFSSLWGVTLGFVLTTLVVSLSRFSRSRSSSLSLNNSFLIGLSQAAAILPGLTRSGTTITASLLLGLPSSAAFEFSFLLSIPTIAGAALLGARAMVWNSVLMPVYLLGFLVAALTGYFSLVLLARLLRKGKFYLFAPYTAGLAFLSLFLALTS